jgi:dTDP-4-dehydrorhamnose 3,5-epimerase-like enzyme
MLQPYLIEAKTYLDHRGEIIFANDFDMSAIKRFYNIIQDDIDIIRAWQGHQVETKYFFVEKGSFVISWVLIDNWENPSINLKAEYTILESENPKILIIPPNYANGIKALKSNSILKVFSNLTLQQSENDRWTFDSSLWINWKKFN